MSSKDQRLRIRLAGDILMRRDKINGQPVSADAITTVIGTALHFAAQDFDGFVSYVAGNDPAGILPRRQDRPVLAALLELSHEWMASDCPAPLFEPGKEAGDARR